MMNTMRLSFTFLLIFWTFTGPNLAQVSACPGLDRQEDSPLTPNPFGNLKNRSEVTCMQVMRAMASKYFMRNLLSGGPIAHPKFFKIIEPETDVLRTARALEPDETRDLTIPHGLSLPSDRISLKDLARKIVEKSIPLPLVYKPNSSGLGHGILFINKEGHHIRLSIQTKDSGTVNLRPEGFRVLSYLESHGLRDTVKPDFQGRKEWSSILLNFGNDANAVILAGIIESIGAEFAFNFRRLDPGMVEFQMEFLKPQGLSYETRHEFFVNLATGEYRISKKASPSQRIKGSFSRLTGKPDGSLPEVIATLPFDHMYDPLFRELHFSSEQRAQFYSQMDALISEEIVYLRTRLALGGIAFNGELRGQFDLRWLAPTPGSNGFPRPVLIESAVLTGDKMEAFNAYLKTLGFRDDQP